MSVHEYPLTCGPAAFIKVRAHKNGKSVRVRTWSTYSGAEQAEVFMTCAMEPTIQVWMRVSSSGVAAGRRLSFAFRTRGSSSWLTNQLLGTFGHPGPAKVYAAAALEKPGSQVSMQSLALDPFAVVGATATMVAEQKVGSVGKKNSDSHGVCTRSHKVRTKKHKA
jgi:hypothetical protein